MARPLYDPSDRKVRLLARLHTEDAVKALVDALGAEEASTRVSAANALLDRGWGKPKQVVEGRFEHEHTLDVGDSVTIGPKLIRSLDSRKMPTVQ